MKVDDFLAKPIPGQLTVDEVIAEVEEPEHVTSLTSSGIEIWYQWSPRLYRLRETSQCRDCLVGDGLNDIPLEWRNFCSDCQVDEWREVPSVTSVLNVLDKSGAIGWWSFRVGLKAVIELWRDTIPRPLTPRDFSAAELEKLIVEHRLSPNHIKDEASGRGVNVHSAFEKFCEDTTFRPDPSVYPENERGYITGLVKFLDDLGEVEEVEAEIMVGSIEHGYAGRYDCRLLLPEAREMVARVYPVKKPKLETFAPGRYLLDVKTSKGCYPTHSLQLAAYEAASVECGYGSTDYRAVVHLTAEGEYELRITNATTEDFISVLAAHRTMARKDWFA